MKIKHFFLLITLLASSSASANFFFSVGTGIAKTEGCSSSMSTEVSIGITLTDQISAQITNTDLGNCEIFNEEGRRIYVESTPYNYYYWEYYDSYSQTLNEVTFRYTPLTSGHSKIFFEGGFGNYNFSSDYSESTIILSGGINMPLSDNMSWETKLKIYPEESGTIYNLGASLTYSF
jgi:hypothetical protein